MKTNTPLNRKGVRRKSGGFTLVEVSLAIGVVAFAFLSIFSLLPLSLDMARDAMAKTHSTRIVQALLGEVQQTPFEEVDNFLDTISYYDGEAQWLRTLPASAAAPALFVYSAAIIDPGTHATNSSQRGVSASRSRTLAVRMATNTKVSMGTNPAPGERQIAFLISDVKL